MKQLLCVISLIFLISCKNQEESLKGQTSGSEKIEANMAGESIYQFKVKDIEGKEFDFASLKGKKIIVVNTASKCGLTPQYEQLQALYDEFQNDNFVIVGFPSNYFEQEPGTNAEIATFCSKNYGVKFPMMEKITVKGDDIHPLYQFLTQKAKNGLEDNSVQWNFQKYLINEKGHLDRVVGPQTVPLDESVLNWIKAKS
jgi:glutathione peroxidase